MNDAIVPPKTHRPYSKAFAWGGIYFVILSIGLTVAYGYFSLEGFGRLFAPTMIPFAIEAFGRLFTLTMISSAICGFQATRSKTPWSFWKVGGFYLLVALVLLIITAYGERDR